MVGTSWPWPNPYPHDGGSNWPAVQGHGRSRPRHADRELSLFDARRAFPHSSPGSTVGPRMLAVAAGTLESGHHARRRQRQIMSERATAFMCRLSSCGPAHRGLATWLMVCAQCGRCKVGHHLHRRGQLASAAGVRVCSFIDTRGRARGRHGRVVVNCRARSGLTSARVCRG